jgi:hypothetical protein
MNKSLNRKKQIDELKVKDVNLNHHRNVVLDEVATEIQTKFRTSFPPDTRESFAIFVRNMKK